jgi:hypothetical protein
MDIAHVALREMLFADLVLGTFFSWVANHHHATVLPVSRWLIRNTRGGILVGLHAAGWLLGD